MAAKKPKKTSAKTAKETKSKAAGKGKAMLIVEDEKPLAHALELKMQKEGFETTVALNGEDALKEAKSGKYKIILLDLILPGVDGFTILEQLSGKKMPLIVVLSNLGQDEDRERAEKLGVKGYLVKSNAPLSEIVRSVKSLI